MSKETLLALAEKIETSPADKVLNREIALAAGWCRQTPSEAGRKYPAWFHPDDCRNGKPVFDSLHGTDVWREPLSYAFSIDAALQLVPVDMRDEIEITTLYQIARVTINMNHGPDGSPFYGKNEGNSIPLAIASAALKARAQSEQNHD